MAHDTRPARISGQLWLILVTVFLNIMGLGLILPVLPFYATAYGADGAQVGLLFTAFSGLQFLASPVFGALSDRYGRRPIILFGLLCGAFFTATIAAFGARFVWKLAGTDQVCRPLLAAHPHWEQSGAPPKTQGSTRVSKSAE